MAADVIGKTLGEAINIVMPIITSLIDVLANLIGFIVDVFTGDWERAWVHIVELFKGIINVIPTALEAAINGAIGVINKLIGGVNGITSVIGIDAIPEIGKVSIPRFHTGGIVDFDGKYEDTIIAKDGEMVLTEDQQRRLFDIANGTNFDYPASSGGSSVINN